MLYLVDGLVVPRRVCNSGQAGATATIQGNRRTPRRFRWTVARSPMRPRPRTSLSRTTLRSSSAPTAVSAQCSGRSSRPERVPSGKRIARHRRTPTIASLDRGRSLRRPRQCSRGFEPDEATPVASTPSADRRLAVHGGDGGTGRTRCANPNPCSSFLRHPRFTVLRNAQSL